MTGGGGSSSLPTKAKIHVVASGESLGGIAPKYGLSTKELMALNNLANTNLRIGQKLKVTKPTTYKVQPGDSIYSIAIKHNTTQDKLRRLNGLKHDTLQAGKILKIR